MLFDRVSFATATTGTGTLAAGAATTGFRTMTQAAVADDTLVEYAIEDGTAWETGTGIVGASGTTLTRVLSQSSTGALLVLTGVAKCFLTPIAARYNALSSKLITSSEKQMSYANGRLSEVTNTDGKAVTLAYENERLSTVTATGTGQTVIKTLVYTVGGALDKVTQVVT